MPVPCMFVGGCRLRCVSINFCTPPTGVGVGLSARTPTPVSLRLDASVDGAVGVDRHRPSDLLLLDRVDLVVDDLLDASPHRVQDLVAPFG